MLPVHKDLNNISSDLRKKLNEELKAVGKIVKYKFYIAKKNPDPEHKPNEEYLYPALYTLTPVVFYIPDGDDRRQVRIGLFDTIVKNKDQDEEKFNRVALHNRDEGILTLDLTQREHQEIFEYLELHPKNENGFFRDKNIPAMFCRIDELKEAKQRVRTREMRGQAMMVATRLDEETTRSFAAAMNWNDLDDYEILKDKITTLADQDPEFFRKVIDDPSLEFKATVKRAIDANIVSWHPAEGKLTWTSNNGTICVLDRNSAEKYIESLGEWLMTSKNGPETFKKIKTLLSGKA